MQTNTKKRFTMYANRIQKKLVGIQKLKFDRQVMIRLPESIFEKLSKEAHDKTLETGESHSISAILRRAIFAGRPDLVVENEQTDGNRKKES